jgi:hypothetical protein
MYGWHELDVDEVIHETARAYLFRLGDSEEWVPKSQLAPEESPSVGDTKCVVVVSDFLARKRGWI